jgi:hypothetical protein
VKDAPTFSRKWERLSHVTDDRVPTTRRSERTEFTHFAPVFTHFGIVRSGPAGPSRALPQDDAGRIPESDRSRAAASAPRNLVEIADQLAELARTAAALIDLTARLVQSFAPHAAETSAQGMPVADPDRSATDRIDFTHAKVTHED